MPLYEYICEQDGAVIELLRPFGEADKPVADPAGKGRVFKRRQSTFATGGTGAGGAAGAGTNLLAGNTGGCCPCGKGRGGCGSMN